MATTTETHSIVSLISKPVKPDEYVHFQSGFSCWRLSDKVTAPDQLDQNESYMFQEKASAETSNQNKRKYEDEDGESRPVKMQRTSEALPDTVSANVFEACLAMCLNRAVKQLELKSEEKDNARLREQEERDKQRDEQARRREEKLRLELQQEQDEQARRREEKLRLELQQEQDEQARCQEEKLRQLEAGMKAEQLRMKADIQRLIAYQAAGTCQKLATTGLIEFACNLLSWNLRRTMARDMLGDANLRQSLVSGSNRPFASWNEITYKRAQWILFFAWRDEQREMMKTTSLAEFWRQQGYPGAVLWEPRPPSRADQSKSQEKNRADQAENLVTIRHYLERAERMLAGQLGLPIAKNEPQNTEDETKNEVSPEEDERSRMRVRILCGIYSTWISGERNDEVHMFALHPNFWDCDMSETEKEQERRNLQEEEMLVPVPVSMLKKAKIVPKLRRFDLKDLQVKLRVLNMVLGDIGLLPEFFTILEEDIRLVGNLVRKCIAQASGDAILRSQKPGSPIPGTNLRLCGEGVVESSKTLKRWRITEEGLWLNNDDKSPVDDPSSLLLGEE